MLPATIATSRPKPRQFDRSNSRSESVCFCFSAVAFNCNRQRENCVNTDSTALLQVPTFTYFLPSKVFLSPSFQYYYYARASYLVLINKYYYYSNALNLLSESRKLGAVTQHKITPLNKRYRILISIREPRLWKDARRMGLEGERERETDRRRERRSASNSQDPQLA